MPWYANVKDINLFYAAGVDRIHIGDTFHVTKIDKDMVQCTAIKGQIITYHLSVDTCRGIFDTPYQISFK